jgi:glycosyltransferase involved in cell wall biosynthesis
MYSLTIFTPAYNRAYILPVLFRSLQQQTCLDFEWVVVDDGSTDDTESLVAQFRREANFPICYRRTQNGGKHRAINLGVTLASGEYFFIVDSDDSLPDNAVERILFYTQQISDAHDFIGVCGLRITANGEGIRSNSPFGIIDTDPISIRERYGVIGDLAEVWRLEILKQYPFPEFEGEKFISEAVVWNRIARKYKLRYFYEGIYICDYLADGLTYSIRRHFRRSPMGTMLLFNENMRRHCSMKVAILSAINYWRYTACYHGPRPKELAPIAWTYLFYPLGVLVYWMDLYKERQQKKVQK